MSVYPCVSQGLNVCVEVDYAHVGAVYVSMYIGWLMDAGKS